MNPFYFFFAFTLSATISEVAAQTAISNEPWQEVVVSVSDIDRSAEFFTKIGGYKPVWRGVMSADEIQAWGLSDQATATALVLRQNNREEGYIRLVDFDNAGRQVPTRPGSRAWDTGCYFSLMVRMKDMQSVYDDAIEMGWWTETPIAELKFGASHLNIVIFKGPDGLQVQSYERLNRPISPDFPDFERFSGPFNLMQMVRNKNETLAFFTGTLGFDVFFDGQPTKSEKPENMPIGIPKSLTTSVRYQAGIVTPKAGEVGRLESIEILDIQGNDYAEQCKAPNLGILAARFEVNNIEQALARIKKTNPALEAPIQHAKISPYGKLKLINIKTPDGANIQFYEKEKRN